MTALDRLKKQKTTTNYESAAAGGGTRGSYTAMDRLWSAPTVQTQRATREEWEDFGDRIDRGVTLLTRPDTNGAGTPVLSDWLSESDSAAVRAAAPTARRQTPSTQTAAFLGTGPRLGAVSSPTQDPAYQLTHAIPVGGDALADFSGSLGEYQTGRGLQKAMEGSGSAKSRAYLSAMTPAERETAASMSSTQLGKYAGQLGLESRVRGALAGRQLYEATEYQRNTASAQRRENSQGRLIADWALGGTRYAAADFPGSDPGLAPEAMSHLTDAQKRTIRAYAEQGDFQAISDYYKTIERALNAAQAEEETRVNREGASRGAMIAASAPLTGLLNVAAGFPAAAAVVSGNLQDAVTGTYTPIDYNAPAFSAARTSAALSQGANERIEQIQNPASRTAAKIAWGGASSAITNSIQLMTGTALGLTGSALETFTLAAMGGTALGQSAYEGLSSGQSNGQALANALADAAIETATEKMFLSDRIARLGEMTGGEIVLTAKNLAKGFAARGGAEALEEVVGNLASQTWDRLYNGDSSAYSQRWRALAAEGLDEKTAKERAFTELYVQQSLEAAASAAFSVLLMDGAPLHVLRQRQSFREGGAYLRERSLTQQEINKGLLMPEGSEARREAEKVRSAYRENRLTDAQLGRLAFYNGYETQKLMAEIGLSGSAAAQGAARALIDQAARSEGMKVTAEQLRALQNVYGNREALDAAATAQLDETMKGILRRSGMIGPDGEALPSFREFSAQYAEAFPDASPEETQRRYGEFLGDAMTLSFGGERMNFQRFSDAVQRESGGEISPEDTASLFQRLMRQQLEDGMDAKERADAQRRAAALEDTRAAMEKALTAVPSVAAVQWDETLRPGENAYYDPEGVVHLNPAAMDSEATLRSVLGHELLHAAGADAAARADLVNEIFDAVLDLNPRLDLEAELDRTRRTYARHAALTGEGSETVTDAYVREELAADLVGELYRGGGDLERLAAAKPGILRRSLRRLSRLSSALKENGAQVKTLHALEDRLQDALEAAPERRREISPPPPQAVQAAPAVSRDAAPARERSGTERGDLSAQREREETGRGQTGINTRPETGPNGRDTAPLREDSEAKREPSGAETGDAGTKDSPAALFHGRRGRAVSEAEADYERFADAWFRRNPDSREADAEAAWEALRQGGEADFNGKKLSFPAFRQALRETSAAVTDREAAVLFAGLLARQNETAPEQGGRYSLRAFPDGRRFVDVQTDQARFDGLSEKEITKLAIQIIKSRFAGKVVGTDNPVFVNGRTAAEYGHPVKNITGSERNAKARASVELDNLIDAGFNHRTAADGADGHVHANVTGGFEYFDVIFKVGDDYYRGVINIAVTNKGRLLKDITKIRTATQDISSSYGQNPKSAFLRDSSINTIPSSGENSKPQNRLFGEKRKEAASDGRATQKGTFDTVATSVGDRATQTGGNTAPTSTIPSSGENSKPQNRRYSITPEFADWFEAQTGERLAVSREYLDEEGHPIYDPARLADERTGLRELARQNAWLRQQAQAAQERAERWKKETRITKKPTVILADGKRLAKSLIEQYHSTIKESALYRPILDLANLAVQGPETTGSASAWFEELHGRARDIANTVVENAAELVNDEEMKTIRELKRELRETPIGYGAAKDQITDWNDFRKRTFGKLRLSQSGTGVDVLWREWQARYGEVYFPSGITAEADMIEHLGKLVGSLGPIYENPYSANLAEAAAYCANDLLEQIFAIAPQTTAADRQRAAYEAALERNRQRAREAVDRERQRGKQRLEDYKQWSKENRQKQDARRRERRRGAELRKQLKGLEKRLSRRKMLSSNEAYRNTLLQDLDASTRAVFEEAEEMNPSELRAELKRRKGGENFQTLPAADAATLADVIRRNKEAFNYYSQDFQPGRIRELVDAYLAERAEEAAKGRPVWEPKPLNELSTQELDNLVTVLRAFEFDMWNHDKMLRSSDQRTIQELGAETMANIRSARPFRLAALGTMLSPERWARRVTGYAENDPLSAAMRALSQGQERAQDYQRRAAEFVTERLRERGYTDAQISALEASLSGKRGAETLITIGVYDASHPLQDGAPEPGTLKDVQITRGMRISLYLLSRNLQSRLHMMEGGISIPADWKAYARGDLAKAYAHNVRVRLDADAIRKITAGMSREEQDFAWALREYFNTMSKQELGKAAEDLLGWNPFHEDEYFPINVDSNFLQRDFEAIPQDGTLSAPGFAQERQNSAKPILLRDANLVFAQAIRQHGQYVGMAIPIRNLNKLLNMQAPGYAASLRETLGNVYGPEGTQYIKNLMEDLQGGRRGGSALFARLQSRYAGGVLGLNASVAIKQAASYPTAAAVIGFEPLLQALAETAATKTLRGESRINPKLIAQYTSHLWYRSLGFTTDELAALRGESYTQAGKSLTRLAGSRGLNWIQGMDVATTTLLWRACEIYVEKNHPGLEKGTLGERQRGESAFYKQVAQIYNRVIEETQPNYTVMQRPDLLRGGSDLVRAMLMFKTQPFQNFNILYDALGELGARQREYRAASGEAKAEAEKRLRASQKNAARAVVSQAVSSFVFALMQYGWDRFRRKDDKYKSDDPDADRLEQFLAWAKGMGINMAGNLFGMVPFGSNLLELGENALDKVLKAAGKEPFLNETYYGLEAPSALTMIEDTGMDGIAALVSAIAQVQAAGDDEEAGTEPDWADLLWKLYKFSSDITQIAGAPLLNNMENIRKTVWPIVQWAEIAANGGSQYAADYKLGKLTGKGGSAFYALLFAAGGQKLYPDPDAAPGDYRAVRELMLRDGFTEKDIQARMKEKFRKTKLFTARRDADAAALYAQVKDLSGWELLDEKAAAKAKESAREAAAYGAMLDLVPGYEDVAADNEDNWLIAMEGLARDSGLRREELLLIRAGTSGMEGIKNAAGKTVAGSIGLRKMERAYSLLPGLSRLSETQRRQVFAWLNVGGTVAGMSSAEVSAALKAIAP